MIAFLAFASCTACEGNQPNYQFLTPPVWPTCIQCKLLYCTQQHTHVPESCTALTQLCYKVHRLHSRLHPPRPTSWQCAKAGLVHLVQCTQTTFNPNTTWQHQIKPRACTTSRRRSSRCFPSAGDGQHRERCAAAPAAADCLGHARMRHLGLLQFHQHNLLHLQTTADQETAAACAQDT